MPHVEYREPATMREALDPSRPGRLVDLDRMPGFGRGGVHGWVMRLGQVSIGFLVYDGATWRASGVLTDAEACGVDRDSVVQNYVRRLRAELAPGLEQQ